MKHDIEPESIDLIYLDPPFFTGKVQKGRWQPAAMEISFDDSRKFWAEKADVMRDKAPMWLRHIALRQPDFASYLYYMMERLQACHRVLKKTGSIYLHCDWRASHYLKIVMDESELFGMKNFRNEIAWCYKSGGASKTHFSRKHDDILYYQKSNKCYFKLQKEKSYNRGLKPYRFKNIEEFQDGIGWYTLVGMKDYWEIDMVGRTSRERVGYPTQKPEALLERIIEASSIEGDLILDPFCGCGTTAIVASKLNRSFIGIDIDTSPREKGKIPTAFQVISNRSHSLFNQAKYTTRDLSEVAEMDGHSFEIWVNEFYKATKPSPDRGVDGITPDGMPIQSKVYEIKYAVLSQFVNDAKYHPKVPKPVKKLIAVSQTGFDDSARKLKFEVETAEGIEVLLVSPKDMLGVE